MLAETFDKPPGGYVRIRGGQSGGYRETAFANNGVRITWIFYSITINDHNSIKNI